MPDVTPAYCDECERLTSMWRGAMHDNDQSKMTDARVLMARHVRLDHPEDAR